MPLYGRKPIGTVAYLGGVPAVLEDFAWSWAEMQCYNYEYLCLPNEYVHRDRAKVSYHSFARNSLVDRMKGDWLLQLDTDERFDPDLCARLVHFMQKHDVDVLTGLYCYKNPPHAPLLFTWISDVGYSAIGDWDRTADIFEVGSAGAGALLVRRRVFDRIKAELKCGPFDIEPPFSEDHSFFNRLRKLGLKAYCAPMVELEHLIPQGISLRDYKVEEQVIGPRQEVEGRK